MNTEKERLVISVGGSLVVPSDVDFNFLNNLNDFIREQLVENDQKQFFLVVGGGATARRYIEAGQKVSGQLTNEDADWLGIHTTRLNAHLLRTIFRDIAHPYVIRHYDEFIRKVSQSVAIASGSKPGHSTDYCAVQLCQDYEVVSLINLTNIDKVYDKDPKKFQDALPIDELTWKQYRAMVGDEWTPGLNAPFDPIAANLAQRLGLNVVILNGRNFENLHNYLEGNDFIGTLIHPE